MSWDTKHTNRIVNASHLPLCVLAEAWILINIEQYIPIDLVLTSSFQARSCNKITFLGVPLFSLPWDVEQPGLVGGVPGHSRGMEWDGLLDPFQPKPFSNSRGSNTLPSHNSTLCHIHPGSTFPGPPCHSQVGQPAWNWAHTNLLTWLGGCWPVGGINI